MSFHWTIKTAAAEESLDDWGVSNVSLSFQNQSPDVMSFDVVQSVDSAQSFSFGDTLELYKDREWKSNAWSGGTRVFKGKVASVPKEGTAENEAHSYSVLGPWKDLEDCVFQQYWNIWDEGESKLIPKPCSHLFLGWWWNQAEEKYERHSTAQVAATAGDLSNPSAGLSAIKWAIHCGASLQLGTWEPDIDFLFCEVRDQTCAEIIKRMLRYHPSAVVWFDYSTDEPTIHCVDRASLTALTCPFGEKPIQSVQVVKRSDIAVPCVSINYQRTSEADGVRYVTLLNDKWPTSSTGTELRTLTETVDLLGWQTESVNAKVVVRPYSLTSSAWWGKHLRWAIDDRTTGYTIDTSTVQLKKLDKYGAETSTDLNQTTFPSELVDGQLAGWMGVKSAGAVAKAVVAVTTTDEAGNTSVERKLVSVRFTATDAVEKVYSTLTSVTGAEDPPGWSGTAWTDSERLSKCLYDALNSPHFEGRVVIVENEPFDWLETQSITGAGMGCAVNISGAETDWATMRGIVQQVDISMDSGTTAMTFGPPKHLGIADIVEWLRENRGRWFFRSPGMMVNGTVSGTSEVDLGDVLPNPEANSGAGAWQAFTVADNVTADRYVKYDFQPTTTNPTGVFKAHGFTETVTAESTGITRKIEGGTQVPKMTATATGGTFEIGDKILIRTADNPDGLEVKLRELIYCMPTGEEWSILVLASKPYAPS
jgi:hypothetical protein